MRSVPRSTQAMFEFQSLMRQLSSYLQLARTGKFWELWFIGDDFGKSEAEIAELDEVGYYPSNRIVSIQIDPHGAIRSFDYDSSHGPNTRSLLQQLVNLIDRVDYTDGYWNDVHVDVRPNGSMIEVDIVGIYLDPYFDEETSTVSPASKLIGRFTYDPARKLLLHCTA